MEHWAYAKKHVQVNKEYRHAPNHEPLPLNKKQEQNTFKLSYYVVYTSMTMELLNNFI